MTLVWLRRAIDDLYAQLDHIAQENPRAAIEHGDRIHAQIRTLSRHPEIGRPGRVVGTRELVIVGTSFIVIYRLKNERVELLRVMHGARQWPPA